VSVLIIIVIIDGAGGRHQQHTSAGERGQANEQRTLDLAGFEQESRLLFG
jgi:hypothetical protein